MTTRKSPPSRATQRATAKLQRKTAALRGQRRDRYTGWGRT